MKSKIFSFNQIYMIFYSDCPLTPEGQLFDEEDPLTINQTKITIQIACINGSTLALVPANKLEMGKGTKAFLLLKPDTYIGQVIKPLPLFMEHNSIT